MKKLLFVLFLTFATSSIYAQVKANIGPNGITYANGDSYGYYIDEIPGAVSYEWSVVGQGATVWPAWDTAIDITYSNPGGYIVRCTVTLDNGNVQVYELDVDVWEPEY